MTSIQTVRTAVNTKLETLKWTNKPFVNVYKYFTSSPSWYPFVMFEPSELQSEYEDTDNNFRKFIFQVVIVQEMTKVPRSDAMEILLNCFEQMINTFDQDFTLSGVVQKVDATSGTFGEIDMESWPCLFLATNLACSVLVSI